MATISGTVKRAYNFEQLRDDQYTDTDEYEIVTCKVDVEYATGTYAQADDSNFAPATKIQNTLRDGQTVTILQAAFVAAGRYLSSSTTTYVGADACAVSSGTVTNALLQEDMSTELGDATDMTALTWEIPVTYQVTFKRKAIGE